MGGGSSPPFLYDPVSQWSFNEYHRDKPFNPKAVTQASRSPRTQPPPQNGPLVNFNRHPDSWVAPHQTKPITPMSRHTKARVTHTRRVQLLFRIISVIGAIGILFCVICVSNTGVALGWIIRVAPSVAILHTIYAIYHLARAAASRPPGSSTSYHLFASCMDAGLVPFYAFTSFVDYKEVQNNYYDWSTLFNDATMQNYIFKILFYASAACSGLHLISLVISIYLAIVFRQITKLPPDMNPLEDNLTARPVRRSKRTKADSVDEKHMSSSTLNSEYFSVKSQPDEFAYRVPQPISFMHTRQQSTNTITDPKRISQTSLQSHRQSKLEDASSRPLRVVNGDARSLSPSTRTETQKTNGDLSRPRSLFEDAPVLRPTSSGYTPTNFRWSSPVPSETSGNWVTYDSPADEDEIVHSSQPPSRSKNGTPFPVYNGVSDWLAPVPRFGRVESGIPHKEARGQYATLETNDAYENDMSINKENLEADITDYLNKAVDPLRMNPPTPQPKEESNNVIAGSRISSLQRAVLGVLANGSTTSNNGSNNNVNSSSIVHQADTSPPAKESKLKTFGSLRLWGSKSKKTTYATVQEEEIVSSDNESDNDDEDTNQPPILTTPKRRATQATLNDNEADHKGRVVSNSGIDLGTAFQTGLNSKQYGEYISGLGVGRRRDVSGKIAEEGRGGIIETVEESSAEAPSTPEKKQRPVRAAGWARFGGL